MPGRNKQTFAAQVTADVAAGTSVFTTLCSIALPPGKFDIQGFANFLCSTTSTWVALRIVGAVSVYGGNAAYMAVNPAHEFPLKCGAALVPGGQVVYLQGFTDCGQVNNPKFTLYTNAGNAAFGVATQMIAKRTT